MVVKSARERRLQTLSHIFTVVNTAFFVRGCTAFTLSSR
jgi:hypothetical protein